jgi:hypothetical protein
MDDEKTTYQLVRDVMKIVEKLTDDDDVQSQVCNGIYLAIDRAKLDVVEDAENFIAKLRVFSLR